MNTYLQSTHSEQKPETNFKGCEAGKEKNMINLASILTEKDFTEKEIRLINRHMMNDNRITWDIMSSAWRDSNDILCISYDCIGLWFSYDSIHEQYKKGSF